MEVHCIFFKRRPGKWWEDDCKIQWLWICLLEKAKRNIRHTSENSLFSVLSKCWMKGLNHQVDEHNIGPNYTLSSLIEINDFATTEGWVEYSDYLPLLLERGSPDLSGCARKRLPLKVYYRQLQHHKSHSTSTENIEGGCSFSFYRIRKSKFCWFGSIGHHSR